MDKRKIVYTKKTTFAIAIVERVITIESAIKKRRKENKQFDNIKIILYTRKLQYEYFIPAI